MPPYHAPISPTSNPLPTKVETNLLNRIELTIYKVFIKYHCIAFSTLKYFWFIQLHKPIAVGPKLIYKHMYAIIYWLEYICTCIWCTEQYFSLDELTITTNYVSGPQRFVLSVFHCILNIFISNYKYHL